MTNIAIRRTALGIMTAWIILFVHLQGCLSLCFHIFYAAITFTCMKCFSNAIKTPRISVRGKSR